MQLLYNPLDELVPPGKSWREHKWDFLFDTVIPTGLEVGAGTDTYTQPDTTRGYIQMTTGAVSGNAATLRTSIQLDLANCRAIAWTIEAMAMDVDTATYDFEVAISGGPNTRGVTVRQLVAEATSSMQIWGATTPVVASNTFFRGVNEATKRHNYTLLIVRLPTPNATTDRIYWMSDDQVIFHADVAVTLGLVKPSVTMTTREGVAHNFKVSQVKLAWIHN